MVLFHRGLFFYLLTFVHNLLTNFVKNTPIFDKVKFFSDRYFNSVIYLKLKLMIINNKKDLYSLYIHCYYTIYIL